MKKLTGSTLANVIVVIAIAVIPLMYAGLLTSAYQNPTNRVYTIQAAVVNEDVAADVELATGKTRHFALGDELEQRLTDPQDGQDVGFTWHSMTAEQAAQDMKDEKIRAILTIPADFTASTTRVATADSAGAAQQQLELRTDDGINYLAGTLAKTVAVNLEDELTAKGAQEYTDNILLSIGTIRTGMEDAESGAEQLSDGADTLQSGLDSLATGTETAASGAGQLASGAQSAAQGASKAASGGSALASGVGRLSSGASSLSNGVDRYTAGVDQAAAGAGVLATGLDSYTSGVDSAAAGAQQLASGAQGLTDLDAGVEQYTAGVDQLRADVVEGQGLAPSLVTGVNALATGTQKLAATIDTAAAAIGEPGASAVDPSSVNGSTPLTTAMATLVASAGSADTASGPTGLVKGVSDYTGGTTAYVDATIGAVKAQMDTVCAAEPNGETCAQLTAAYTGGQSLLAQADPLKQAASGVGQLARAVEDKGVTPLAAQMQAANDSSSAESVPALNAGAQTLAGRVGTATDVYDPPTGSGGTLAGVLNTLSSQSQTLRTGATDATQLVGGTATLNSGLSTLSSNSSALRDGASGLSTGAQQLSATSPALRSGASSLASGASEAADGADTLTVGLRELSDGTTTLATRTGELATGLGTLDGGARKAADGSTALMTGITKLSDGLSDGVDRIPDYSDQDSSHIASVISKPVSVEPVRENAVANNGAGFTPMFMSLALWVGGIAIFLVLPALDRRPSPTERWWMAPLRPAVTATILGVAQAVVLMVVTNWSVGLHAVDVGGLVLLAIASSLTFVALNQMFVATLAYRGRFVSIAFLCLQITSMGATFPIETAPRFFQWIHPWLPMSYTQLAFREMLAGSGATHAVRNCLLVLLAYFLVAVVLTFVAAHLRSGRTPLPRDNALLGDSLAAAAEADRASARVRADLARGEGTGKEPG
ncbi:YhgE/Pip domain-containing protein, partial [Actinomyces polynesiensis]|uniref:YhgE/Pip domain-containing protein n=1 Tax=Actinomyces polynesiensis TaxID=1325934 RepID=UPI0005B8A23C